MKLRLLLLLLLLLHASSERPRAAQSSVKYVDGSDKIVPEIAFAFVTKKSKPPTASAPAHRLRRICSA